MSGDNGRLEAAKKQLEVYARQPSVRIRLRDLPTPPEVAEAVEEVCRTHGFRKARHRQRIEDDLKYCFYFGGVNTAVLPTPEGRIIVAVGDLRTEQFGRQLEQLSPEERTKRFIFWAPAWDDNSSYLS
jgi:hypothetical protein